MATRTGKHNRKLRIGIHLKLWKDGKLVLATTKRIKNQIIVSLSTTPHDRGYIKVTYTPGFWNDGYYDDDKKLLAALSAFTEKTLTDEFGI
jgi:hypothetical protein